MYNWVIHKGGFSMFTAKTQKGSLIFTPKIDNPFTSEEPYQADDPNDWQDQAIRGFNHEV